MTLSNVKYFKSRGYSIIHASKLKHDVKGYGLSLYYVATMMRLHGGEISVESEKGKGTTFNLLFR